MTDTIHSPSGDHAEHRKKVMTAYIFLLSGFLLSFAPHTLIHLAGIISMIVGVFQAYGVKNYIKKGKNSNFTDNHARYMIRSFWIGSLYLSVGVVLAVVLADHSPIYQMVDRIMYNPQYLTQDVQYAIFLEYAKLNWFLFLVTLGPGTLFFFYRYSYGLWHSYKGQVVPNYLSWY